MQQVLRNKKARTKTAWLSIRPTFIPRYTIFCLFAGIPARRRKLFHKTEINFTDKKHFVSDKFPAI